MNELTIRKLDNTDFPALYKKLIQKTFLSIEEKTALLKIAVILLNCNDSNLNQLGYRIILKYSLQYNDYLPLYDTSINKGYIPICKSIESNELIDSNISIFREFISAFEENFLHNDIYFTEEQHILYNFFIKANNKDLTVVAPTSYGKSELILTLISENLNDNICVIVPTKSLLSQTKRRIIKSKAFDIKRKIITHPEMYNNDKNFIAILTQERALRLLQKDPELSFKYVVIDEAHNILENDSRSRLLATVVIILKKRNPKVNLKWLTPFLIDVRSLDMEYHPHVQESFKIKETIKSENIFFIDIASKGNLLLYDQFFNTTFVIGNNRYEDDIDFIEKNLGNKNIIYLNRPRDTEKVAYRLSLKSESINKNYLDENYLEKVCLDLGKYLHQDYVLIDYIKKGIVYHHGCMPDNIRLFVESLYTKNSFLRCIVTTSTLLEGVNIPGEKLFMLSKKKGRKDLSHAQFKNLIGRICRFSEIFKPGANYLDYLEPEIYIIKSDFMPKNANIITFLEKNIKLTKNYKDDIKNVLLENTNLSIENKQDKIEAEEFIANQEDNIIDNNNIKIATTDIGKLCFKNNITEFNIIKNESSLQNKIDKYKTGSLIDELEQIMPIIADLFISYIINDSKYYNLKRLENPEAQKFYTMILEWKINQTSYSEMINKFLNHWKRLKNPIVYVGSSWGEMKREFTYGAPGHNDLWLDISKKNDKEKVNLAIVRIKEEQDFIENNIVKYLDILNEAELLEKSLYNKIKYGTDDDTIIKMIANGIGLHTAKLLREKYSGFYNIEGENIDIKRDIIQVMQENMENEIIIFEVDSNIKI